MKTKTNLTTEATIDSTQFWCVYLLRCGNGNVYVGCTSNLENRLQRHNKGQVPATQKILPVELVCFTAFPDKYKAYDFERYLKSGSGRAFAKRHWR